MLKEDQSYTKQRRGEENTKYPTNVPMSTFTHSQWGEINTDRGFHFGPCPHNPGVRRNRKGSKQLETHLWDPSGVDVAAKFSSMLGMLGREGVGELLDLSRTGAAAGAGSREKSQWVCVCDAPHEPDQGIPHPSPSFPSQSSAG